MNRFGNAFSELEQYWIDLQNFTKVDSTTSYNFVGQRNTITVNGKEEIVSSWLEAFTDKFNSACNYLTKFNKIDSAGIDNTGFDVKIDKPLDGDVYKECKKLLLDIYDSLDKPPFDKLKGLKKNQQKALFNPYGPPFNLKRD